MNRPERGISNFAKMRRTLLACVLGSCLAALWPGVAPAKGTVLGPAAVLDSATDDGGGRIRISWSLEPKIPDHSYLYTTPDKACVAWGIVKDGAYGKATLTCFTSEASSQADLVVDTGIGEDGPTTVYWVRVAAYYEDTIPIFGDEMKRLEVTLNSGPSLSNQ